MKVEEKGAVPSVAVENSISNSAPHTAPAGAEPADEKQVEELARVMCSFSANASCRECSDACFFKDYAKKAIEKGWRKQSEGECKTDNVKIYPYCVISKDGDVYQLLAEEFKHDSGGFAFYIGKQKVAWFDYGIVKALFIINGGRNEGSN